MRRRNSALIVVCAVLVAVGLLSGCTGGDAANQPQWKMSDFLGVWKSPKSGEIVLSSNWKFTAANVPSQVIPVDLAAAGVLPAGSNSGTWDIRTDAVDTNIDLIPGLPSTSQYGVPHGSLIVYGSAKSFILCFMSDDLSAAPGGCDITYKR